MKSAAVGAIQAIPVVLWLAYLVAINIAAFTVFAWDKHCARVGRWRVPESTLLTFAAVGGSPAMIAGQYVLRHKTWKQPFRTYLIAIAVIQVVALVALAFALVTGAFGH